MLQEDRTPRPSFPSRYLAPNRARAEGTIRPIYAAVFDLDPNGYDNAVAVVLDWVRTHGSVSGHEQFLTTETFDLNLSMQNGLVAQATRSPDGNVTVIRLQHREADQLTGKLDRLRDWRTEITIERDAGHAWIATRQWFAGLADDDRKCYPPRFLKDLWAEEALSDIDIFERSCRVAEFDLDVDDIADLIRDHDRDLPVIVMADGCPMEPGRTASQFTGLAHVVRLTREARLRLNAVMAEERVSLDHGSLQTFYPRLPGEALVAPASRFETIIAWRYGAKQGPAAFSDWLRGEVGRSVVTRAVNDKAHRSYEEIRTKVIQAQRAETSIVAPAVDTELIQLAEDEIADLRSQVAEVTERAQAYLSQKSAAEAYAAQEAERNNRLQADKLAQQHALNAKNEVGPMVWDAESVEKLIAEQPSPRNTFEAVEQAQRLFELHGRQVVVSTEAEEGAMEALNFKRPADIQAALIRLGFLWNDIRDSGQRLDIAAKDGLRHPCSMFESETTMRNHGGERAVHAKDTIVYLEKHIKFGSGGKDDSARIYFGDKDGEILIGHVGRHLTIAKTS